MAELPQAQDSLVQVASSAKSDGKDVIEGVNSANSESEEAFVLPAEPIVTRRVRRFPS